ncbi:MAG: RluA family pseudouridine synthase [bacterium]|nr:RluA family pseudouridine synthase [bacterium]
MNYVVSDQTGRLDKFIHEKLPSLSRSFATKLCDDNKVRVNDELSNAKYKIKQADKVTIDFDIKLLDSVPKISLPVIFEDDNVIVIDKPEGILTHSKGQMNLEPTVASFIANRISIKEGSVNPRAGIVHRLDRATSGVIICAKTLQAQEWLKKQFANRYVKKTYVAVVEGRMEPQEALIDMPIGRDPKNPKKFKVNKNGKTAQTYYKVLDFNSKYSKVLLKPTTGRTHQLRVHLFNQGHPLIGDKLYGGKDNERMLLHAWKLEVTLPNNIKKVFEAKLPKGFTVDLK